MKEWFWKGVENRIERLEDESVPFIYYVGIFVSVIFVRSFLELVVYRQSFNFKDLAIHYNLFWVTALSLLLIIFYLATKEKIEKIARVLLASFTVVLTAPLIDLLVYGREVYQIQYILKADFRGLIQRFFTYFGPLDESSGISIGMRLEILVIISLCFIYFIYKNKDLIRSLIFSFLVYAGIFFIGSMPSLLDNTFNLLGREIIINYIQCHLLIIIIFVTILFYLVKRRYLIEIIKDIRPYRMMHFQMMFFLGLAIGHRLSPTGLTGDVLSIILTLISILFACLFSLFVNNIVDYDIDKVSNKERPLVTGSISLKTYKKISALFFLLAVTYSLAAGYISLFFIIIFMGNYFLYSVPPLRLKRIPILSKLPIALNSLLLLFLGHSFTGELLDLPVMIPIFFFTVYTLGINFIDIKDHEGDKKEGIKTIPVLLGLKKAKLLIGAFFALAVFSSYFLIEELISLTPTLSTVFILILGSVGVVEFYLINREEYEEAPVFITYLILLFLFTYILFVL